EDGIRDYKVTGVQTCALPISHRARPMGAGHGVGRSRIHVAQRRMWYEDFRLYAAMAIDCRFRPALQPARRIHALDGGKQLPALRSEERRVGKECRSLRAQDDE